MDSHRTEGLTYGKSLNDLLHQNLNALIILRFKFICDFDSYEKSRLSEHNGRTVFSVLNTTSLIQYLFSPSVLIYGKVWAENAFRIVFSLISGSGIERGINYIPSDLSQVRKIF